MNSRVKNSQLLDDLFKYLALIGNSENAADQAILEQFLSRNFFIESNNETVCRNIQECIAYIEQNQSRFSKVTYSNFLEDPIITENKAVIHFHVECTLPNQKQNLNAIAILSIVAGRITRWIEVYHEI
jgi:hypothetical protein